MLDFRTMNLPTPKLLTVLDALVAPEVTTYFDLTISLPRLTNLTTGYAIS